MAIKHDLQHSIRQVLTYNRDGSYATQADRQTLLMQFATDVTSLGFGLRHIQGLKTKHIQAVLDKWQSQGLTSATLKNRLSALRYLATKINKAPIVPSNKALSISPRCYVPTRNRAIFNPNFENINNRHVLASLHLQRVFGLRREESLKIRPHFADKGHQLVLQPSWCKGGRGRSIPIETDEQRYWLDQAKIIAGDEGQSLIPVDKSYIRQRHVYDKQVNRAGFKNLHGLRHAYAQMRYEQLTGWKAPINGGFSSKQLTSEQKKIDRTARLILTEELGHSREQITVNYLAK